MLYISRRVSFSQWGVVDTATNSETVYYTRQITKMMKGGAEINGVKRVRKGLDADEYELSVWHNTESYITKQVKTLVMLGVDIGLFEDEIVYIYADRSFKQQDRLIRLSDYGHAVNTYCPISWVGEGPDNHRITLVLDDSVQVVGESLTHIANVRWDVREVTNMDVTNVLYKMQVVRSSKRYGRPLKENILDNPERMKMYEYACALTQQKFLAKTTVAKLGKTDAETSSMIASLFRKEFTAISDRTYAGSNKTSMTFEQWLDCISDNLLKHDVIFPYCTDYETLRREFDGVFNVVITCFICVTEHIGWFENYICLFEPTEEMKQLFVLFCNNVSKAIVEVCKKNNVKCPFELR